MRGGKRKLKKALVYILKVSLNAVSFNAFANRSFLAYGTLYTYIYDKILIMQTD